MSEETIFDKAGQATAYIADDGESIYTWDGEAVAYIRDGDKVYGWNGQHLGSFSDGIIYDIRGYRVGFLSGQCPVVTSVPPIKSIKSIQSIKSIPSIPSIRSIPSMSISTTSLIDFLRGGA